ncbi:aerolysin-like protein [Selaginella moellendorffii]|uniref:aerolysin-like protein n=1 Tax=Selaginella moellendorffii TaxID=88036 RepID=UPI000D1C5AF9|nr:aerolysin-like protein [Selaginella moellendorffii]|eukprot:XP_024522814.1 aerolysin-like protein [Selaginella moellendorffii]
MSLWLGEWDHVGDRAGATMFTTSLGNTFQHGYQGGSATVINVYSGILVGADIRAGDDLNAWGFAFLRPLVSCQLQDVTYGDLSMGSVSLQSLDSYSTNVAGDGSFSSSEQSSIQKTISSSWSQSEGVTSSMDVTVTATIPEIGEVGGAGAGTKYEWQESETYTSQASIQAVQTLTWSVNWTLVAGQSISLQAQTHTGSINVPYQGTMVVTVVETTGDPPTFSFETFNFPQSGTYTGVSVTAIEVPITVS